MIGTLWLAKNIYNSESTQRNKWVKERTSNPILRHNFSRSFSNNCSHEEDVCYLSLTFLHQRVIITSKTLQRSRNGSAYKQIHFLIDL